MQDEKPAKDDLPANLRVTDIAWGLTEFLLADGTGSA